MGDSHFPTREQEQKVVATRYETEHWTQSQMAILLIRVDGLILAWQDSKGFGDPRPHSKNTGFLMIDEAFCLWIAGSVGG